MTTLQEHIRDALAPIEPWVMAESANHTDTNDESHRFYENIRDAVIDAVDEDGELSDEATDEIADNAPSIWNKTRMLEVIGTQSYFDEPDLGDGNESVLTVAGYVLYQLARDVVYFLEGRITDAKESYSDPE
jgi:hypothetical protein